MKTSIYDTLRRSFSEFLAVPFGMVAAFLVAAWGTSAIDAAAGKRGDAWSGWRRFLDSFIGDPDQANQLMSTIATSLVTMSSITFSILLLAVQQSSAALTNQVVDQFMRRRTNQMFFGFFVGASLFVLSCLGLAKKDSVPVLATSLSLILAVVCLLALVALIYTTLDQSRPTAIIGTIHDTTVTARRREADDLEDVRVVDERPDGGYPVRSRQYGYLSRIDFAALRRCADAHPDRTIVIDRSLGAPVCHGQPIARVIGGPPPTETEADSIRAALRVTQRRELQGDPTFGVDQLGNVGWTSISTAKSNPAAGLIAVHALNDLLFRWGDEGLIAVRGNPASRVIYRDTLIDHMACAYEGLMVVASESMQHQSLAEVAKGIARAFPKLPHVMQDKLVRAVEGSLSALGDHVPTDVLCRELERLEEVFRVEGHPRAAAKLQKAWESLARARGDLHSRADRVPGP
ncbi:DUF2254 domain-containing protein [Tsuneonella sp. YG55]|uniref:DUF2254 domain-containing protein n=1 Tax=Tsuneonella litorea TaxID=2976475 RepID=A0A9X2W075_9SPHN|nr:DUF2254 domain-containing protein [Tsuneonella litorea]MCT2557769.1 DUF2254 domain-containing protein [Tsuneonella litorea]